MNITDKDKEFMRKAIRLADDSVKNGGGPFGAVIVKDGEAISYIVKKTVKCLK